jgi:hypothetical protein
MMTPQLFDRTIAAIPWDKLPAWLPITAVFLTVLLVGFIAIVIWDFVGRISHVRRTEKGEFQLDLHTRQGKS